MQERTKELSYWPNELPKITSKLGYGCPICGLDYGGEETVIQKSTRSRGTKRHALSKRRTEEEKIHLPKITSKPVEYALSNLITDHYENAWLDAAADGLIKSLRDGTWNSMSVQDQESLLKKIAEMKAKIEPRNRERTAGRTQIWRMGGHFNQGRFSIL